MKADTARDRGLAMIEARRPLREVLTHLAASVEALSEGKVVSSILLLDREGLLRNGASPNLPADYLDAIDRLQPDPELGTCAAAAATGEVVVTRSFLEDQKWAELRHLPLALGFQGAWSMPLKTAGGRVLGTFGTYFRDCREPTPEEWQLVAVLAAVAVRAIESEAELA